MVLPSGTGWDTNAVPGAQQSRAFWAKAAAPGHGARSAVSPGVVGRGYFSPEVTHAYPGVTHGELGPLRDVARHGTARHTRLSSLSPDPRLRESPFPAPPQVQHHKERSDTKVLWGGLVK